MCGRYALEAAKQIMLTLFHLENMPEVPDRYNIAPTQLAPVVRQTAQKGRSVDWLKWGLVPSWASDPSVGARMINARSETIQEKPSFRQAFRDRRCVVPCSGFFEWQVLGPKHKQPHFIHPIHQPLLPLAGIWERWTSPEGVVLESFSVLTTRANGFMQTLHDRMPVILDEKGIELWLDPTLKQTELLRPLLEPANEDLLTAYPVTARVSRVGNDDRGCLERLSESTTSVTEEGSTAAPTQVEEKPGQLKFW